MQRKLPNINFGTANQIFHLVNHSLKSWNFNKSR